jgi:myotubularin-related protein 6/7/8
MVGLTNARSIQDEKLVEATFTSHVSPESRVSGSQPIFGATATNLIIDARPTTNAFANTAKGAGTENMDYYKDCRKAYLGIDNIHSMRDSLNKVIGVLSESEALAASVSGDIPGTNATVIPVDRQALRRSGWLRHQAAILEGTLLIVRNIHVSHSHVLIHCSDGWDRTAQLSAVSQLCLDPYYRTTRGFQILIEKDFLSFGHRFLDRCGHLSSEKFFLAPADAAGSADVAQAVFASVQNRFSGNHHLRETSPVFHQFLEAVRNIQRQFPTRFEFNELFLRDLHTHLYSCQFGTFLFNSERERREGAAGTVSVWDYMNSQPHPEKYINPEYNPALDDPSSRAAIADQGVLFPNPKDVRFWHELYGRGDEEMNGRYVATPAPLSALSIVENPEEDPGLPGTTVSLSPPTALPYQPPSPSPASSPALAPSPGPGPGPARVPSPLAPGPRPVRATSTDLFGTAGEGVRSVWDRLSSGAGAALSVVQDAYGTTRDARARSAGGLGELQDWSNPSPRRGSPSMASSLPTLSRFEPPRLTEAVRASTFSSVSKGTMVNPWATTSLPSSASTSVPREADGGIPSVLVDNPWNTARMPPRPTARRPPLEDAFAVGGLDASLPPLPSPASDPLGMAGASTASTSHDHDHHGLPVDPFVALPTAAVHVGPRSAASLGSSASVSSAAAPSAPPPPHAGSLDASSGTSSSAGDDEVGPKIELSGINPEEMDPLGVGMR